MPVRVGCEFLCLSVVHALDFIIFFYVGSVEVLRNRFVFLSKPE